MLLLGSTTPVFGEASMRMLVYNNISSEEKSKWGVRGKGRETYGLINLAGPKRVSRSLLFTLVQVIKN